MRWSPSGRVKDRVLRARLFGGLYNLVFRGVIARAKRTVADLPLIAATEIETAEYDGGP